MKTKLLTFLLSLTFLFLFSSSVYADDYQDGMDAFGRKNYKTAHKLLLPSAEQGVVNAQVNLGTMYYEGHGVPQDYKEAAKWFRLSAKQGNVAGQYNLGLMYRRGHGVPQDYKEAAKWFRLPAEQGFAPTQGHLGLMYAKGEGVLQDYVLAHMWLNLCGSDGIKECVGNRNMLEKKMTPSQIAKAQEMARNWKQKNENQRNEN
jgi:uncharacterized protein